jgi:F-type H+-transporting ATPase subunit gamma
MASTRELVKRRKAIRNIRKITRTMELIATALFKKALDRAVKADAFTRKISELAADLSANAGEVRHPLLETRPEVKNSLLLVICSNRGLCGGYNAAILREANNRIRQVRGEGTELHLEASGKRAIVYFRFQRMPVEHSYTQFDDKPKFEQVEVLANRYMSAYTSGAIDRVDVAWMKFLNAARQQAVVETLLPLGAAPAPGAAPGARARPRQEYEFLPDAAGILTEILPMTFKVRLFKCFLDAAVSEQIARRVAMKAATDNADEIIRSLSQKYNRARQSKITTELSEIIGGAAAVE